MFERGDMMVADSGHYKYDGTPVPGISGKIISKRSNAFYNYYLLQTTKTQTAWVAAEIGRH